MNKEKKIVKVKYNEGKDYELEVQNDEQIVDGETFKEVKNTLFVSKCKVKEGEGWKNVNIGPLGLGWLSWTLIIIGAFLVIGSIGYFFFRKKKSNLDEEEIL